MEEQARFVAPAAVALFGVIGATQTGSSSPSVPAVLAVAGVVLGCVGMAARPLQGWPLLVALLLLVGLFTVVCAGVPGNVGWFGVCLVAGWAGFLLPRRRAVALVVVATGMFVVEALAVSTESGWNAWIAGTVISGGGGAIVRRQRELVEQLREAQAGLADRARTEERQRIAHELHDVIGHALTVSLLHVTSARLALAEDPVQAEASLAEAERLAQQSLAEVRAVVGLMRDPAGRTPLPGAGELEDLVTSFRRAGTEVDWQVQGDLTGLSATEGLTVYRIVQEALTNVARHAPGSPVTARLELATSATRVVVDSAGAPTATAKEGAGLSGMRQRAEALGGELSAGPRGDGWRVEAVLPS
ncbi:MAG: sensor histidine kinase [Nocardioides sp.]|nr:sensor histidine kinase [Nocardioides sp.]